MRKKPDPAIIPLAARMFAEGIRVKEVCERADVSATTWSRWASGGVPNLAVLRRLEAALEQLVAEDAGELVAQ